MGVKFIKNSSFAPKFPQNTEGAEVRRHSKNKMPTSLIPQTKLLLQEFYNSMGLIRELMNGIVTG